MEDRLVFALLLLAFEEGGAEKAFSPFLLWLGKGGSIGLDLLGLV